MFLFDFIDEFKYPYSHQQSKSHHFKSALKLAANST